MNTTSSVLDKVNLTGSNNPYLGRGESEPSSDGCGPWLCGFSQRNLLGLEEGETVPHYHLVSQWVLVKDEASGTTRREMRLPEGRSTIWDFNADPSVLAAYSG